MLAVGLLLLQMLQAPAAAGDDDAQIWLLEVRLGQQVLADALPVQQRGVHLLLPLGELCRMLDLAVEVDASGAQAAGFLLSEDRRFQFDAASGMATANGVRSFVPLSQIAREAGEIYLPAGALQRLLPVNLVIDLPNAVLRISPREPLPVQQRLERERRAHASGDPLELGDASYPRAELPHRPWSVPFMDLRALGSLQPGAPAGGHRGAGNYSALLTGDLLFLDATGQAAGTTDKPLETTRLTLGRKDPDGGLLGPLHAREISAGEVSYPGSDLLAYSMPGTGFVLSNVPLNRPTEYDRHTFRGPLPMGWDVEIYQNDALVGYQQSRADGRYEFEVPVLFDLNVFRLVFYGPEGQKREETHTFNVGQALTPPGELRYRVSAAAPEAHGARSLLGLELGLARNLSVAVDGASVELPDGRHVYGKAALLGGWSRLFATATVVADERGGWGTQGAAQIRLEGIGLTLKRLDLTDFHSERLPAIFGTLRSRTSLRIDGTLFSASRVRLPIALEAGRDDVAGGSVRTLGGQISASYRGYALSNQLTWLEPPPSLGAPLGYGVTRFGKTHVGFSVRSEAGYQLRPTARLSNLALVAEAPFADSFLASAGVNQMTEPRQTRLLAALHKTAGRFGFGVLGNYAAGEGVAVTLSVFAGLQRDEGARQWHSAAHPISGTGAASTRVFFDANDNGKRDPGERPIAGAGFLVNNGQHDVRTDGDGNAFIADVPTYQETALGLSVASLEDAFWISRRPGVRIVARPGSVAAIEFPVVVAAEINGTVYLQRDGVGREMSGIKIELRDAGGALVKTARSAYDGFYELSGVAPGRYRLQVEPNQAARLGLSAPSRTVALTPSGTILDGVSLILTPVVLAPNVATVATGDAAPPAPPAPPAAGSATAQ